MSSFGGNGSMGATRMGTASGGAGGGLGGVERPATASS